MEVFCIGVGPGEPWRDDCIPDLRTHVPNPYLCGNDSRNLDREVWSGTRDATRCDGSPANPTFIYYQPEK